MVNSSDSRIAVVGIGAIGFPIARRLVQAGYDVVGVEPASSGRARAAQEGIACVPSIADVGERDVVVVLVATGEQLLDVVRSAIDARAELDGKTWVIVSTVGPADAREAARLLTDSGARVVDAPVTGGVPGAETGRLKFLAAGPPAAIAETREVLAELGEVLTVGASPGDGQAMKLVNQLCSSTHLVVAAEAVAVAASFGLDPARAVEVISGGSGSSWYLDDRGPRMADRTATATLTRLAILAKDNGLVAAEADRRGAFVPMLEAARQQYRRAAEMGLLEADDSQIVQTYLARDAQRETSAS